MLTTKPNQNRQLFSSVGQNSLVQTDQNMIIQNGNRTANAEPPCAASADIELSTTPTGCDAMDDLDILRPEVQEALAIMDRDCPETIDGLRTAWGILRDELLRLDSETDRLHRVACEQLRRAQKAEAELLRLMDENTLNREGIKHAHAELAAIKARVESAPIVAIANIGDPVIVLPDHLTVPNSLKGKRVRLVVEE